MSEITEALYYARDGWEKALYLAKAMESKVNESELRIASLESENKILLRQLKYLHESSKEKDIAMLTRLDGIQSKLNEVIISASHDNNNSTSKFTALVNEDPIADDLDMRLTLIDRRLSLLLSILGPKPLATIALFSTASRVKDRASSVSSKSVEAKAEAGKAQKKQVEKKAVLPTKKKETKRKSTTKKV